MFGRNPNVNSEGGDERLIGNVQFSRKTPICKYYAIFQFGIAYLIPKNKEINTKNTLLTFVQISPLSLRPCPDKVKPFVAAFFVGVFHECFRLAKSCGLKQTNSRK